jgi:hypothetical protein
MSGATTTHAEEAVHLRRVEGHRHHVRRPGRLQQVGHQARGDRDAGLVFLVGPGIRKIGDDGVDIARCRAARDVQHHQQLQQVLAGRRNQGLDDEHFAATHAGPQLDIQIVVAEARKVRRIHRHVQIGSNAGG